MAKTPARSTKGTGLRRQAEELLRATKRDIAAMPATDVQQLVHELQVHQIELDMQNDELRRAQAELEVAGDRYVDLYDFSPAGHLTLDLHGTIVEANLRAGTLLGVNRKELIGQSLAHFVISDHQDLLHRHGREVLKTGTRQACELRLQNKAAASWVFLQSLAVHEGAGRVLHWRTALLDISDRKRAELELEAQRAQLEGIIASAMDALITMDEEGRVVVFNQAAESMFLCRRADAIGQPFDRFIPERFRQAHHGDMNVFARTQGTSRSIARVSASLGLRANGEEFPCEASISNVQVGGKPLMTVILRDVTERKMAEQTLQSNEALTRSILNSLSAHICVLDQDGVIVKTNDAWNEFSPCNSNRTVGCIEVGQNYLDVYRQAIAGGQSTAQMTLEGIEAVLTGRAPSFTQEYVCHSPEEERWFLMRVTALKGAQGVVISHSDISERGRMGQRMEQNILALKEKREQLEFLSKKLIEAQEEEHKRIARELHDDFNQRLAALSVELESMERTPIASGEPLAQQLAAMRAQVVQLSNDLHDLAYRLHPSLLEHVGLEVALRDHAAEFTKRTGLPVKLHVRKVPGTLSPEIATNLFRMAQEALQNACKHAQATEVAVKLTGSPKGVGLSVRDNGKGFDLERTKACVKGLGLVSMQERARGLGGFLRIHSLPKGGTKVCAWIPHVAEDV